MNTRTFNWQCLSKKHPRHNNNNILVLFVFTVSSIWGISLVSKRVEEWVLNAPIKRSQSMLGSFCWTKNSDAGWNTRKTLTMIGTRLRSTGFHQSDGLLRVVILAKTSSAHCYLRISETQRSDLENGRSVQLNIHVLRSHFAFRTLTSTLTSTRSTSDTDLYSVCYLPVT